MARAWLLASLMATAAFTLAWVRLPMHARQLRELLSIFISYAMLIGLFAAVLGVPLARFIERRCAGRWPAYLAAGAVTGGTLPALFVSRIVPSGEIPNPFALVFSPWTRDRPGFAGDVPVTGHDYAGSIAFGMLVGAVLGLTFWYAFSRRKRLE